MRFVVATAAALLVLTFAACAANDPAASPATGAPAAITSPVLLAGGSSGYDIGQWETIAGREVIVYSVRSCSDASCESSTRALRAADGSGQPWEITDLDQDASFEISGDGAGVLVSSPGQEETLFPIDGPAPETGATADNRSAATPEDIDGFVVHNEIVTTLADGRYLIRGSSELDEAMESWFGFAGQEKTSEPRRPIRLFLYDPTEDNLIAISDIPESTEVTTAVGTSFGPDIVLRVQLLAGANLVAYSVGFNGAAYDIEHALYLAPVPPR